MISLKENKLKKLCFSSIWNLETVCWHIHTRWQIFFLSKSECLMKPIRMLLFQNQKTFSEYFFCISRIYIRVGIFWKKRWASEVIFFWNYRLQKAGLFKCQKSPVLKHLWTVNMLMGSKHLINAHDGIFAIFFDHSERKWARKNLFWKYMKSWDCLLTYWHPMTSILSHLKPMFNATKSNAFVSKSKNIFSVFLCIPWIYLKIWLL